VAPNLVPAEPLTEVTFVHDYVQLGFQGDRFSLYNRVRVSGAESCATQGKPEFAGALVALIGQRVERATQSSAAALELHFPNGVTIQILRGTEFESGPECFQFTGNGSHVVERNE
jgi:hypothetical protein